MNVTYHKWMELEITHNYFKKGIFTAFELSAFEESAKRMNNYDILSRKHGNTISIYAGIKDKDQLTVDQDLQGLNDLYFQFMICDELFYNYSAIPMNMEKSFFYFKNAINPNSPQLFQKNEYVTVSDLLSYRAKSFQIPVPNISVNIEIKTTAGQVVKTASVDGTMMKNYSVNLMGQEDGVYELWLNNELQETFFCTNEEIKQNCLGIVHVKMKDLIANQADSEKYTINFNSRSVYWQYQVVVPSSRKIKVMELNIEGSNNENFEGPVQTQIIGNQTAQVFTTTNPIPLKDSLEESPMLQVSYSNDFSNRKNQMELKLPNPEVEQLNKNKSGGDEDSFFSTTIVYV